MTGAASSTGNSTPTDRAVPERWTIGKSYSANYYYDEITSDQLPPDQMDLSDYWVVKIVQGRNWVCWNAVFLNGRSSCANMQQVVGRIYGLGPRKRCLILAIIVDGTYDELLQAEAANKTVGKNPALASGHSNRIRKGRCETTTI